VLPKTLASAEFRGWDDTCKRIRYQREKALQDIVISCFPI